MPLLRTDSSTLRSLASLVGDAHQRDEMAAPSYLHANPLIRWLFWQRLESAARLLGPGPHAAGLDYGCGLGLLLPTLAQRSRQVYAADLELRPARQLVAQRALANVRCLELDEVETAIEPGSLDYVVATDVLEHVPDLDGCIAGFARLLRPGGVLVMSGPTETALYRLGRRIAGFAGKEHYHHTNVFQIRKQILGSGRFGLEGSRRLPVPFVVDAFLIDRYARR